MDGAGWFHPARDPVKNGRHTPSELKLACDIDIRTRYYSQRAVYVVCEYHIHT
jgi:hypothetical protein